MINELRRFSLLLDFNNKTSAEKIVKVICEDIRIALDASIVDVRFYREAIGGAVLESFISTGPDVKGKELFIVKENPGHKKTGLWSLVVKSRKDIWIENIPSDFNDQTTLKNLVTNNTIPYEYTIISPDTRSILVTSYFAQGTLWGILSIESNKSNVFNHAMIDLFSDINKYLQRIIKKTNVRKLKQKDAEKAVDLFCDKIKMFDFNKLLKPGPTGFFSRPFAPENKIIEACIVNYFDKKNIEIKSFNSETSKLPITDEIIKEINYSDFGIVDISNLKPNVMIELGYLMHSDKELFILQNCNDEQECPFNLQNHECFKYKIVYPEPTKPEMQIFHTENSEWRAIDCIFDPFIEKIQY